jgi:hypothetical protein
MSTKPPDEEPGPAFPGLKMGLGGAERAEPAPSTAYPPEDEMEAPPMKAAPGRPAIAFWVAVLIAVAAVIVVVLLT